MDPKISVVIPVYNIPANYLCGCLDSILAQDYSNIEVIIINDCSPLKENDITIRDYSYRDNRIVYEYLEKNGGVSNARNIGLSKATGEFITFVDSDDVLPKDSLSQMYEEMQRSGSDLVISSMSFELDSSGNKYFNDIQSNIHQIGEQSEEYLLSTITRFRMSFLGKLYKKEILNDLHFPNGIAYFEDYTLLWQLATKYPTYSLIPNIGYITKFREGSASRGHVDFMKCTRILTSLIYSVDKINELFPIQNQVRKNLFSFVIRESFACREIFAGLGTGERKRVFPVANKLYQHIKDSHMLSIAIQMAIKLRLLYLQYNIGSDKLFFYITRFFYRIEAGWFLSHK